MPKAMEWILSEDHDPECDSELYWIIVYPCGDRTKLSVAGMCDGTSYEESDYDIASSKRFRDKALAEDHCTVLAERHGLSTKTRTSRMLD